LLKLFLVSAIYLTTCEYIIDSLILDQKSKRPDLQLQPFIPIDGTELLMLSPSLVYTSNWEVCLLRNWAKKPGKYGDLIAHQKLGLEDEVASCFFHDGLLARSVSE